LGGDCGVGLQASTAHKFRFAAFELDSHSAELYKSGTRVKLQGQPLAVLALLVERPGELVSREELRKRLWPEHTFVDFEHSLNTHIKKLRHVLDDDAETPRYIETLPRRGYRFVARVEVVPNGSSRIAEAAKAEPLVSSVPPSPGHDLRTGSITTPTPHPWKYAAVVLALAAVSLYWLYRPRTPVVTGIHQLTNSGRPKSPMGFHQPVTDGTRVYFDELDKGVWRIAQVSIKGGDVSYVDTPLIPNPRIGDISEDGSELLVASEHGHKQNAFWIVQLPSGQAQRLPDMGGECSWMQFLPGSNQIVYSEQNQLFAANRDGTNSHRLVALPASFSEGSSYLPFAVSPNAKLARFPGKLATIWQSNLDGSGFRQFLPGTQEPICCGTWSPDRKLYIFARLFYAGTSLWAVTERSLPFQTLDSRPVQLTNGPVAFPWATVGKDGKQIFAIGEHKRGELSVYDPGSHEFRPYLDGLSAGFLDYSPDHQWITYVAYPEGTLWRSRVDGSQRQQLTLPATGVILSPKWSPDGHFILFNAWQVDNHEQGDKKIYLIPAEGGSPLLLVSGKFQPADPTWSPDGKSIAYAGAAGVGDATEIRILNLDTRQSRTVNGSKGMFGPRWSPDGRYIAAQTSDERKLFLYNVSANQWRELLPPFPPGSEEIGWPAWSHDSRFLYFMTAARRIYRIQITNGHAEQVLDAHEVVHISPAFSWGWWFQLTPDDRVAILADRGTDELYALDLEYR
jgi:DNA-binding winged helix-turn-helix (wHTH) protein/Tol biopolymer transport system component